jgi:hypothetical protein
MPELIGFAQFMLSFVREIRPQGKYDEMKEQLNGDCPNRDARSLHERCDLICPDLPNVLLKNRSA